MCVCAGGPVGVSRESVRACVCVRAVWDLLCVRAVRDLIDWFFCNLLAGGVSSLLLSLGFLLLLCFPWFPLCSLA